MIHAILMAILDRVDNLQKRTPHQLILLPIHMPLHNRRPQIPTRTQIHHQKHELIRLDDPMDAEDVRVLGDGAVQVDLVVALG